MACYRSRITLRSKLYKANRTALKMESKLKLPYTKDDTSEAYRFILYKRTLREEQNLAGKVTM